jgi:AcrR family transcriptional regulator
VPPKSAKGPGGETADGRSYSAPDAQRAEEILRVAAELFAQHGYNGIGMRGIAAAIGIQPASLYHHFRSKQDVLFPIILNTIRESAALQAEIVQGEGTVTERLSQLIRAEILHLKRIRNQSIVSLNEEDKLTPEQFALVHQERRQYRLGLEALIRDGIRTGELRVEDPRLATVAVLDLIKGISTWFREDDHLPIEEVANTYVHLIVPGLLRATNA